jgi:hypothetical protein
MPGVVDTSHTFATDNVVTSTLLNNIIDQTLFTSDALSGGTLALVAGKMKVATSGITSNELATNAVTSNAIVADAVVTAKIADGSVTTAKIADAQVTTAKILDANVTTAKIADANVTPAKLSQPFVLAASQASTSGTFIDFTGIPSTAKRITMMISGLSTSGTNAILVRLGDSGGFENTGYLGATAEIRATPDVNNDTSGILVSPSPSASDVWHGAVTISKVTGNRWVATVTGGLSNTNNAFAGGSTKELSDTLTSVRLIASGDTFDAGTISISYE